MYWALNVELYLLSRWCFLIGGHGGRRQWAGRTGDFGGLRKNQVQIRASRREARLLLWSSGVGGTYTEAIEMGLKLGGVRTTIVASMCWRRITWGRMNSTTRVSQRGRELNSPKACWCLSRQSRPVRRVQGSQVRIVRGNGRNAFDGVPGACNVGNSTERIDDATVLELTKKGKLLLSALFRFNKISQRFSDYLV
ncbi:hypothetical protein TNCV_4183831 [Trichonephila clavipes]|nr:hypothetical protein TNCV_4183831 [Trichonephila clavipes]